MNICKIMCKKCQWDYRGRYIKLKSHLSHLYNKHGGFTLSEVNSQNRYFEFIPLKIYDEKKSRDHSNVVANVATKLSLP